MLSKHDFTSIRYKNLSFEKVNILFFIKKRMLTCRNKHNPFNIFPTTLRLVLRLKQCFLSRAFPEQLSARLLAVLARTGI